jgi:enoyl-CoA hydratase/carnithine racemase
MIDLDRDGDVFVLRMDSGENRFHPEFMTSFNAHLDEVEQADGPKALVITGSGKFYSNGLDLDYLLGDGKTDPGGYLNAVLQILSRVLVFPAYTVAAVNGHAFGAGAQLVVAHDFRIMRADRGFFCMPEIDMKVPLHPGMTAILQARLPIRTVQEVITTGKRYGGEESASKQIVDAVASKDALLGEAVARAGEYAAKAHPVMSTLKRGMFGPALEALGQTLAPGDF